MKKKLFFLMLLLVTLLSCSSIQESRSTNHREYQVGSYLWYQTSGELRALCYQAYNLARFRLSSELSKKSVKPKAVVFDIDETVLDNSVGGAIEVRDGIKWSKDSFNNWVKLKSANLVPGVKDFIDYALKNNVEVIFISNRYTWQIDDTFENLSSLGLSLKKENFYFLESGWSKQGRRDEVESKFNVLLYFGDNLHDFSSAWDGKMSSERRDIVDINSSEFGQKFIILPNPLYGDWENSLPKVKNRLENLKTSSFKEIKP